MKKLNLVAIILIALVTITSCNKKDNLTPQQLIVQNSPWNIDHLELLNVVNNGNSSFNEQSYLEKMNSDFVDFTYTFTFKEGGTGDLLSIAKSTGDIDSDLIFTWEITVDNKLILQVDGQDPVTFEKLVITNKQLTFSLNDKLATDVTGDLKYICFPKK